MPIYYFDQCNGRRIVDAAGVKCNDDIGALATAKFIAAKIDIDKPMNHKRYVAVLNEAGDQLDKVPVRQTFVEEEPV